MRLPLLWLVPAVILFALVPVGSATAGSPTKPCKDDRRARCGSIGVPLYRGAPDGGGRTLRVQFRVFGRTDRSKPALEPICLAQKPFAGPTTTCSCSARFGGATT